MSDDDLVRRLRTEFRVKSWWPGMDAFDSARGETEPHPLIEAVADAIEARDAEIERLRHAAFTAAVELSASHYADSDGRMCAVCRAQDGSWPCAAREVADDLLTAREGDTP